MKREIAVQFDHGVMRFYGVVAVDLDLIIILRPGGMRGSGTQERETTANYNDAQFQRFILESGLSPSPLGYLGFLVNEKQSDAEITREGAPCRKLPSIGEWMRACIAGSWRAIGARAVLE